MWDTDQCAVRARVREFSTCSVQLSLRNFDPLNQPLSLSRTYRQNPDAFDQYSRVYQFFNDRDSHKGSVAFAKSRELTRCQIVRFDAVTGRG